MKRRLLLATLGAGALALPTHAQPQPVPIPPELAPHVPQNLMSYYVAFLVSPEQPRPMSRELLARHQAYMRGRLEASVYRIFGPLTDGGRIRGMVILSAASVEEARNIVAADPSVQEGALAVEVHPAVFPSLDGLRIEYGPRP